MGHRNFPNSFEMFRDDQSQNRNHQLGYSYHPMGGFVASESSSIALPVQNMSIGSVHCDPQWNLVGRDSNQYASSSLNREIQSFPPAPSLHSYYPFPHSASAGNLYMPPNDNALYMHSSNYDGRISNGGIPDPLIGNERGSVKRKSSAGPAFAGTFEGGNTSRSYGAGSSSSSYQMLRQNPILDYQSISSGPISIPEDGGTSLTTGCETSLRNVRNRATLDIERNTMRTHLSSYPSQLYHPTTFLNNPSVQVETDGSTSQWNHRLCPDAAFGRAPITAPAISGSSHTVNQFTLVRSAANAGVGGHYDVSSRFPVSSSHISTDTSTQTASGSYSPHSRRPRAVTSASLLSHRPISNPRYSRALLTSGWHNSSRNGRSSIGIEGHQSVPGVVDARNRMGTQVSDHSSFYRGSRSSFDQYRDMMLDIDNMSYEELLALGETIGNVSTGLSEDTMSKCLTVEIYCSGDQNCDGSCAICLEEYIEDVDTIGTLKSCGHGYHVDCIKKWLGLKNFCPICKVDALTEM